MPVEQKIFWEKSLPAGVLHLASNIWNWINFTSKLPTVEQNFAEQLCWVLLNIDNDEKFDGHT